MSFINNLREYHDAMVESLKPIDAKMSEISFKLDAHYEAEEKSDHDCDCEYCPYGDVTSKDLLSPAEIEELEQRYANHKEARNDSVLAIKRLERYAEFVEKPLPKEVLIK